MSSSRRDLELSLRTLSDVDDVLNARTREIEKLLQERSLLRAHRNTLAPIGRLPPELLALIFDELAWFYRNHVPRTGERWSPHGWLVITFVCRTWRTIALHSTRLWCNILLHPQGAGRIAEFMKRSRQAPLFITQQTEGLMRLSSEIRQLIVQALPRTTSLSCTLDREFLELSDATPFDAPLLRKLAVSIRSFTYQATFPILSAASWPRLSELDLSNAPFEMILAMVRPTLTALTVRRTLPTSSTPSAATWIELLRQLPELKELDIQDAISGPFLPIDSSPPSTQAVTLPHLRWLALWDNEAGLACTGLLNHLIFPAECHIHIYTTSAGTLDEARRVFRALTRRLEGCGVIGRPRPIRGLSFDSWRLWGITIQLYAEDISVSGRTRGDKELPEFDECSPSSSISLGKHAATQSAVVQTFISALSCADVQAVRIMSLDIEDEATWQAVSTHLPHVRELEAAFVGQRGFACLIDCLRDTTAFKRVDTLLITGVSWNKRHRSKRRQRKRVGSLVPPLIQMLETRKDAGLGVEDLQLQYCLNVEDKDGWRRHRRQISALVEQFKWVGAGEDDERCETCTSDSDHDEDSSEDISNGDGDDDDHHDSDSCSQGTEVDDDGPGSGEGSSGGGDGENEEVA